VLDVYVKCSPKPATSEIMWVGGAALTVRPIAITDVERLARTFERLSPESVRFRFFSPVPRLPQAALVRLADVDHCRREALVALDNDEIVAVASYDEVTDAERSGAYAAEIALTVEDAWQRRGVGRGLVRRLGALAVERGYDAFVARILPDNRAALGLMRKLAPGATVKFVGGDYEARFSLTSRATLIRVPPQPGGAHPVSMASDDRPR
jgi:GNAT superfamily N-acetyltransferase